MAFQTSLSGLSAAQANLSVTGNNIANSSTNGFKKSRAEFADIYASTFGGASSTTIGSGVRLANVAQQFTQGNVEFTESGLDLAVGGEGFFVLKDADGTNLYTRAGAFGVDRSGFVVNSHGQRLQSYTTDPQGVVTNFTPQDLQLNTGTNPAAETNTITVNFNLDASQANAAAPFDPLNAATYNFSTSTTVYDSLGTEITSTLYFSKVPLVAGPPSTSEWEVRMEMTDVTGASSISGPVNITYDGAGNLVTPAAAPATASLAFFGGGAGAGFNPGTGANAFGLDVDITGSTQFSGSSTVNSLVQDGNATGRLSGIDIDPSGVVFARYTNGQSNVLGAVAMAQFSNKQGLQPVGDTNWAQTFDAGSVIAGQAGTGTFGQIQSGALESSNVDISQELVNMIVAQRDFQANAKMISTEDQVTQTIINIR